MVLDRRMTQEIVQALIRARNKKDGGNGLGGMGLPSTLQPGLTTGDKAANQSRKFTLSSRPHPFHDPRILSYRGEAADMAKARRIPSPDELAFKRSPSPLSGLANPQTTYGRPLAANAAEAPQQGYWDQLWENLFPSYCKPSDDTLTFPPLVNQVSEADKIACQEQHESDQKQCYENHSYKPDALRGCLQRADTIRDLCLRGEKELLPWNDVDSDGIKLPKPGKRPKK